MKIQHVAGEVEARTGIKKNFQMLLAASILCNLLIALVLVISGRTHRETIIPPQVDKTFWVEGDRASPEYLEMMSKFAIDLALTNTPRNCKYNAKLLLNFVGSGSFGEFQKQLNTNCDQIIDNGASTQYIMRDFNFAKGRDNEAVIGGVYTRWIAEKKVYEQPMSYFIKFGYSGGRMYIYELAQIVGNPNPVSLLDPKNNPITSTTTRTEQVTVGEGVNLAPNVSLPDAKNPQPSPAAPAANTN